MYKNVKSSVKDVDETGRIVVAANAFGNVDSDKDVSMRGSFTKTLKEHFDRVRWYLNHKTDQLLGVPIEGIETPDHLQIVGQLNLKVQIAKDIYEHYKLFAEYGKSLEHSIGVDAIKVKDDQGIRRVFEWKLWEYSTLTSWGANPNTPVLAIKENKGPEAIEWLELIIKKGNFSDEAFMSIESHLDKLKMLLEPEQPTPEQQPLGLIDLADISTEFLKTI